MRGIRPNSTSAFAITPSPPTLTAMFNLSGSEIFFLLLIALVVLGPEKLPEAMRRFGKTYSEVKKMSTGFQSELKTALDEPMREMRDTADALRKAASFDLDGDGSDTPATTGPANAMAAATPAGNEPPLANAAPFQSIVISGGDAAATVAPVAAPANAPADAAAETSAPSSAHDPEPAAEKPTIVRAPGINFGSANPRPTAATIVPAKPDQTDAPAEPATVEGDLGE
jgi:sec-independent protein translocase protein TatB